jgi:hypothetical protein
MTDVTPDRQPAGEPSRELGLWERWTTDWNGDPIAEFDVEAHAAWCEKWAPRCPSGNQRFPRRALGFRERNIGELELRVALGSHEGGVCDVIVDERDDEVYVRVLLCYDPDDVDTRIGKRKLEYTDCPVRVWLERPLGDRAVIDVDTDEELPYYTFSYEDNIRQPDHGYQPANRRNGKVPRPPGQLAD